MKKSLLKEFTKYLIISLITGAIVILGGYGEHLMSKKDTTPVWNFLGFILFTVIIIVPSAVFWTKTLIDIFTEDEV
jgi:lipid-binding SYLF domain-containing protein